jgi:hypothetical protein
MPTLMNTADRDALLARLRRLEPSAKPRWGRLTAPKMVCHLADSLRIALGEVQALPVDNFASRTILKWLVVYSPVRPPPGKIETSPEMLATAPASFPNDVATVEQLVARTASTLSNARHPFFGPLSPGGWGRLNWKHLDHHLRQFGV